MLILGVSDSHDAGAALVIDDRVVSCELQERCDRQPRSRAFPWGAADVVLEQAGVRPADVDLIAVAGRYTPPFFLRRHPTLRMMASSAFSPLIDAQVFFQAMLRQSGMGALEADRAAEWLEARALERGYRPQRTLMVDIHKALAEGAFRSQPSEDCHVITLHPQGDGVSFAVHRGVVGQLDRLWEQKGFASLHVHLARCVHAVGLRPVVDDRAFRAMAARAAPDPELVAALGTRLRAEGPRLSRQTYPMPTRPTDGVYGALARVSPEVAAASVAANLRDTVASVVRHHLISARSGDVALAGDVVDDPRLVADLAQLSSIDRLWVGPQPGFAALALGAAQSVSGLAPSLLPTPGLGRSVSEPQLAHALNAAGFPHRRPRDINRAVADLLAAGKPVARFTGSAGFGRYGLGSRAVLLRADDVAGLAKLRDQLALPETEEPGFLWLEDPTEGHIVDLNKLRGPARYGSAAPRVDARLRARYPAAMLPDGRVRLILVDDGSDAELAAILTRLREQTGCGGLVALPLAGPSVPLVALPADAIGLWRQAGLTSLQLGPFLVDLPNSAIKGA